MLRCTEGAHLVLGADVLRAQLKGELQHFGGPSLRCSPCFCSYLGSELVHLLSGGAWVITKPDSIEERCCAFLDFFIFLFFNRVGIHARLGCGAAGKHNPYPGCQCLDWGFALFT